MKIVNVEDFFHPEAGYQVNLLSKYHKSFGHEVTIICAELDKMPQHLTSFFDCKNIKEKDEEFTRNTGVKIIRLPFFAYVSGRVVFWENLIKTIRSENPDIVYAHGNDTYTAIHLILFKNSLHCPIVSDSHMVDMASYSKFRSVFRIFYRLIVSPVIIKNSIPIIRTVDDNYVTNRLGIPISQAPYISFGTDTLLFHPDENDRLIFRKNNNIKSDDFVVVYAGKLDVTKGGKFLADSILKAFSSKRRVVFLIVGNTCGENGDEIENLFLKSENRVLRFPTQKYRSLPKFFASADLAVFPRQCSLTFFDAQACGLPVLSEDNNINVSRCSHNNGWNFKSGDSADFRRRLEYILSIPDAEYNKIRKASEFFIAEHYDYCKRAREYEAVLVKQVNMSRGETE